MSRAATVHTGVEGGRTRTKRLVPDLNRNKVGEHTSIRQEWYSPFKSALARECVPITGTGAAEVDRCKSGCSNGARTGWGSNSADQWTHEPVRNRRGMER